MNQIVTLAARAALLLTIATVVAFNTYRVFHRHRSYGEGPIVALAERMRSEPVSVAWLHEPPYTLSCYGPGYYWAINAVAAAGGWRNSLLPGRLVSLFSALVAAALAALAAGWRTRRIELGLLAALLFLVSLPVNEWLPYARVDLLAVACTAAAYLFVAITTRSGAELNAVVGAEAGQLPLRDHEKASLASECPAGDAAGYETGAAPRQTFAEQSAGWRGLAPATTGRWALAAAALSIVAGALVKPTVALNVLPIAAHLLANRRRGAAVLFVSLTAIGGAASWAAVQWATDGFFLSGVLLGNRNPMYLWRGYLFTHQFLLSPLAVGALMVVAWRFVAAPARFAKSLFGASFVISLVMSAVLACKRGSEVNYFLEPALLAALAIAVDGAAWLCTLGARRAQLSLAVLAVVLAAPYLREVRQQARSPAKESPSYETARRWLQGESPDVGLLADGRMVQVALAAGHTPWINDSYLYMLLADNGTLDVAPLVERLEDGRIKWLLLRYTLDEHREAIEQNTDCWPPEVIEAFPRYYELLEESDGLYIYRHRRYGESLAKQHLGLRS